MGCRSSAPTLPSRESARVLSDARAGRRQVAEAGSGIEPELIEERGLCLLHAPRGIGIAACGGDALESIDPRNGS